MSKRNITWTEEKYKKFISEQRGSGTGIEYKPWFTIQDFPSMGRSSRIKGWTTGRIHYFLSDTQRRYFYCLDWEKSVVDIRESYPLLDLNIVLSKYDDLKLQKFISPKGVPYVITTTFLITTLDENGEERMVARAIKYASELEKKITQEKLEIERRYWEEKDIEFGIVTNKDINMIRSKNIEWINPVVNEKQYHQIDFEVAEALLSRIMQSKENLQATFVSFERDYDLEPGSAIRIFKMLLSRRVLEVDMNKPIDLRTRLYCIQRRNLRMEDGEDDFHKFIIDDK